ncbi:hypothetical protein [Membranihabitans marinus]|uniref:hypothetical protein n=1 Tax=Membranihabitans marinus TaxID=1227546 RepID=UPI001F4670A9|nr:hypothetical protein [Membranihabitans marinus]
MKAIVFTVFNILILFAGYGQSSYGFGQNLYVWNHQGTTMYETADKSSNKVGKFYYGQQARVVDMSIKSKTLYQEIAEGLGVGGHWVKVIIKQDTGYVFDGDLARMEPLLTTQSLRGIDLVSSVYKSQGQIESGLQSGAKAGKKIEMDFDEGIHFIRRTVSSCISEDYIIDNADFNEAYYLMYTIYSNLFVTESSEMIYPVFQRQVGKIHYFTLTEDGKIQEIQLQQQGQGYKISTYHCDTSVK